MEKEAKFKLLSLRTWHPHGEHEMGSEETGKEEEEELGREERRNREKERERGGD